MARHRLDPASLVAGLAFVVVGLVIVIGDLSFGEQADLVWPLLLGALGTGLLLTSLSTRHRDEADPEAGDPPSQGDDERTDDWLAR